MVLLILMLIKYVITHYFFALVKSQCVNPLDHVYTRIVALASWERSANQLCLVMNLHLKC